MNEREYRKAVAFDSYCKKIIKNETKDYYSELKKRQVNEVLFSELSEWELNKLYTYDTYDTDFVFFSVLGFDIFIRDCCLADALSALPERKRNIILLSYCVGLTDEEIGRKLSLIRATVQYNRTSGIKFLRRYINEMKERGASP